jgi:threonine dehydrogenase-like Zn-dependent dehydrogenase
MWRKNRAKEMNWKLVDEIDNFDIIYHTTATEEGLQYGIDHLKEEGKLIELSWYGNKSVKINLGKEFHYKRLSIISSQVSVIPKMMRENHSYSSRKELAFKYLEDKSYDDLISHIIPFEETPSFFDKLRKGNLENGLIWIIKY